MPHPAVHAVDLRQPAQAALPLDRDPANDVSLRNAFARSGLARHGWSFDRAVKCDAMRRCLINITIARLRARAEAGRA